MIDLPNAWEKVLLKEIADINSGIGFPKNYQGESTGDLGFFKVRDISEAVRNHNGRLWKAQHFISFETAKLLKGKPILSGSTVFAKIGEAIRLSRRAFVEQPCLIDNNVMAVKSYIDALDLYIYYYLRTVDFSSQSRATTVPSLRKSDVEQLVVPLAPLNEQKRIADKLDRLLAKVDACRERCDRIPLILKRFRQSVLAAATSGELTEDWREQKNLRNEDWQRVLLGSIVNEIRNGISAKPDENPLGVSILRISSVRPFSVNFDDHRRLSSKSALDIYLLKSDDLLFTRYNGTLEFVGVCAKIRYLPAYPVVYPDKIIRVRVDENLVVSGFIEIATNSPLSRKTIEGLAKTSAGQTGISGKDLKSLQISLPTLQEQNEIVRRVEKLFAFADRLESRYQTARAKCDQLTPALLEKAFQGELVPQDPNDEPVSVLLERIKSLRSNAEAKQTKPQRRKTAPSR
jgi:type I restriction enzyme, S subunit